MSKKNQFNCFIFISLLLLFVIFLSKTRRAIEDEYEDEERYRERKKIIGVETEMFIRS